MNLCRTGDCAWVNSDYMWGHCTVTCRRYTESPHRWTPPLPPHWHSAALSPSASSKTKHLHIAPVVCVCVCVFTFKCMQASRTLPAHVLVCIWMKDAPVYVGVHICVCKPCAGRPPQGYIHSLWWLETCRRAEQSPPRDTVNYNTHARAHTCTTRVQRCHAINPMMHVQNKKRCVHVCVCANCFMATRPLLLFKLLKLEQGVSSNESNLMQSIG